MSVVSVISSTSSDGSRPELVERVLHGRDEVVVGELAGREVDRDRERRVLVRLGDPRRGLRARFVQHPRADRHDQAGLLGDREELVGRAPDPRSGCCQRSSASRPITSDDSNRTSGW